MPKHILIVDDSKTVRNLVAFIMRKEGFKVTAAEDGLDGLERWPEKVRRPRSYRPALKACLAALEGGGTVENARAAVVRVARDADILDRA